MLKNRQLAQVLTLAQTGNFSRAAKVSNLSQPAFSRSIRSLENDLGVSLFDRDANSVVPTQYGEIVLRWAQQIVAGTEELEREIRLTQGLEAGGIGVAMAQFPAELSGGEALSRMALDHPDLQFNIIQSDWQDVRGHVLSREVDLGYAEISIAEQDSRLETELVGEHNLMICCRSEHPLSGRKRVSYEDLFQYPLVAVPLPKRLEEFPGKSRYDEETELLIPSVNSSNLAIARKMITGSNAIAPFTPVQIENELANGSIKVLPYWKPFLRLRYGFVLLRNRLTSPAAELFMEHVRALEIGTQTRNRALFEKYLPQYAD